MKKQENKSILAQEDRKRSQGYVNLKKLTETELKELLQRQQKLLNNKSFISKLPDKGTKILSFKNEIENEIEHRRKELDITCDLLEKLKIKSSLPEDLEWNSEKCEEKKDWGSDDDSDDNVDPLKLIASHSGVMQTARKSVVLPPEPSLITQNDLQEIKYEAQICEKFGKVVPVKERFKPNQLRENNKIKFAVSAENVKKQLGEKWEVTEATPPVPVFKDVKMISLSESLQLQKEQAEKLKEIEREHATERLFRNMNIKMGSELPTRNITEYRSPRDIFEETVEDIDESKDIENCDILLDDFSEPTPTTT